MRARGREGRERPAGQAEGADVLGFVHSAPHSSLFLLRFPGLTHDCEVDLGLPAAQLVLHHQCVAATVLLPGRQDGELAAALAVLHLDMLALLDLWVQAGVRKGGSPLSIPKEGWAVGREQGSLHLVWCGGAYLQSHCWGSLVELVNPSQANEIPCLKGGRWLA